MELPAGEAAAGGAAAATQPYKELFLPILNIGHLGKGSPCSSKG